MKLRRAITWFGITLALAAGLSIATGASFTPSGSTAEVWPNGALVDSGDFVVDTNI